MVATGDRRQVTSERTQQVKYKEKWERNTHTSYTHTYRERGKAHFDSPPSRRTTLYTVGAKFPAPDDTLVGSGKPGLPGPVSALDSDHAALLSRQPSPLPFGEMLPGEGLKPPQRGRSRIEVLPKKREREKNRRKFAVLIYYRGVSVSTCGSSISAFGF